MPKKGEKRSFEKWATVPHKHHLFALKDGGCMQGSIIACGIKPGTLERRKVRIEETTIPKNTPHRHTSKCKRNCAIRYDLIYVWPGDALR